MAQNTFSKLVNNLSATEKSTLLSKLLKYTDESVNEEVQNVSKIKTDKSKTKEFAQKEFEKFLEALRKRRESDDSDNDEEF